MRTEFDRQKIALAITVQYITVQYITVQYITVQYITVQYITGGKLVIEQR